MFGKQKPFTTVGDLIDGLPLPVGSWITVDLSPNHFLFQGLIGKDKKNWPTYELPIEQVENVQLMNQREIQQVIEQSTPGMIIGGAAFGILGAMVGGRIKTKEKVKNHNILVVDYQSGDKKQIILDVTNALKDSERLLNRFKELKPVQNSTVQL